MVSNSVIIPQRDLFELSELPDDTRNTHRTPPPLRTRAIRIKDGAVRIQGGDGVAAAT
jgi:hypothetical protein